MKFTTQSFVKPNLYICLVDLGEFGCNGCFTRGNLGVLVGTQLLTGRQFYLQTVRSTAQSSHAAISVPDEG